MSYNQTPRDADVVLDVESPNHGRLRVFLDFKMVRGRFEVGAIAIESAETDGFVTPVVIRNLGLAELIRNARTEFTTQHPEKLSGDSSSQTDLSPEDFIHQWSGPDSTRDLTREDLLLVASLYSDAYRLAKPVQRYVAESLGIAVSTAARRISLARKAGFIDPEINRKPRKEN